MCQCTSAYPEAEVQQSPPLLASASVLQLLQIAGPVLSVPSQNAQEVRPETGCLQTQQLDLVYVGPDEPVAVQSMSAT